MKNALIVTSSAQAGASVSSRLAGEFESRLRREHPGIAIVRRDVGADPIPHLTAATVAGIRGIAETEAEKDAQALSDVLVAELQAADLIVIGAPMYNFSIPSQLKAWIDRVVVAGQTFKYTETGPVALTPAGKRVIVASSRGGFYTQGPAAAFDFHETYLKAVFTHIGIPDVTFVRAEGIGLGEDARNQAIEAARGTIGSLGTELREAA